MFCNRCGTPNPDNSRFCMKCGQVLNPSSGTFNQQVPPQNQMHNQAFSYQNNMQNNMQNNQNWTNGSTSYPQPNQKKKKKRGCGCGCLPTILIVVVLLGIGFYLLPDDYTAKDTTDTITFTSEELASELSMETYITTEVYREATVRTMELLNQGPDEVDLETWQQEADEILVLWDTVEKLSSIMEDTADEVIEFDSVALLPSDLFINPFVSYGLTQQDVNAIYDSAPKGQGLKTLAKQLNVTSKEAFKLLKSTNEEIVQTWNNKADTYQKLENTARAVKDVSKATVFVGSLVATGGASSLLEAGVIAVSGAYLAVEICEDMSIIQYGDDSSQAKSLGKLRSVTEPVASIVGLTGLKALFNGKNIAALGEELANLSGAERKAKLLELGLAKLDQTSAILMTVDQTSAYVQDNKILGISLDQAKQAGTKGTVTFQGNVMTKDEARANNITVDFSDPQYTAPASTSTPAPTPAPQPSVDATVETPQVIDNPTPAPAPVEQVPEVPENTADTTEPYQGGSGDVLDLMDTDATY